MTVSELIERLEQMDRSAEVVVRIDAEVATVLDVDQGCVSRSEADADFDRYGVIITIQE